MMPEKKQKPDKLLTIAQAARRLGCHPSTVRRYILDGKLTALQYARYGKIRIAESEIDRFKSVSEYSECEL
jgi:excisionase family DNA binding protein